MCLSFLISGIANAVTEESINLRWMNNDQGVESYDSSEHPNAIFVVESYFFNCSSCNQNAPNINALAATYHGTEIQVLDIGRDCRDGDYKTWIIRHRPKHPVLNDCEKIFLGPREIKTYPTTFILDCHLKPLYRHEGILSPLDMAHIRSLLRKLLDNNPCEEK